MPGQCWAFYLELYNEWVNGIRNNLWLDACGLFSWPFLWIEMG